ncbi:MAG: hydrolase [Proteobacteria bacterium]|nr:hydrolase [Pseudomonadota bacterium]
MSSFRLDRRRTSLVVIDVQDKLMGVMGRRERMTDGLLKLCHLANTFDLPLILTEQYPKWLGPTVPEIKAVLPTYAPIEKLDFDCCAVAAFNQALDAAGTKDVILTGVETHVCVLQTCRSLRDKGFGVHVPQDAVDSRTEENWRVGLDLMKDLGAVITSAETVIFQMLERAGTPEFKAMMKVVK